MTLEHSQTQTSLVSNTDSAAIAGTFSTGPLYRAMAAILCIGLLSLGACIADEGSADMEGEFVVESMDDRGNSVIIPLPDDRDDDTDLTTMSAEESASSPATARGCSNFNVNSNGRFDFTVSATCAGDEAAGLLTCDCRHDDVFIGTFQLPLGDNGCGFNLQEIFEVIDTCGEL